MTWLTQGQLNQMGFAALGEQVFISDKASFYNCAKIEIGNYVRIDDFCVLSAGENGIKIGNYVHIAVYASLIGAGKIELSDFCNLSGRVSIYSSTDDFSGVSMTNPLVPIKYKKVLSEPVFLEKHVIVGAGSIILPGVSVGIGAAIGALSLVRNSCQSFGIYAGQPAQYIKERKRDLLHLEQEFFKESSA